MTAPVGPSQDERDERHVKSTMRALPANVLFQVCCRVMTFVMNAVLLRYVTRDALGVMNVRLLLLYSSCQFMSREAFRRTISESKDASFAFLSVPASLAFGLVLYQVWTKLLVVPTDFDNYQIACFAMVCAVVIEMLAEPFFIISQKECNFFLRIFAEAVSLIVRSFLLLVFVVTSTEEQMNIRILMAFGFGQFLGSCLYCLCFLGFFFDRTPGIISSLWSSLRKSQLFSVTITFMGQTIVKQLLTEGERFLMTFFNPISFADQGVYDVVNNLASLAARFILAPVEESSYLMFSSLIDRQKTFQEQDKTRIRRAFDLLKNLVKVMTMVGLIIFSFGFSFSQLALTLYASRGFAEGIASELLQWQSLYILIISVNGVTEAFAVASMTEGSLKTFNVVLVFLSIIFIITSYFLTTLLGSLGFILANSINMFGRILHSMHFIHSYRYCKDKNNSTDKFSLTDMLPEKMVIVSFCLVFVILKLSERMFCCSSLSWSLIHVLIGLLSLVSLLFFVYVRDRKLVQYLVTYFKTSKQD